MKDEKIYQEQFTKGFNDGYLMGKYEPELYEKVKKPEKIEQPYFSGLDKGYRQCQREMFLANLKNSRKLNEQLKPRM